MTMTPDQLHDRLPLEIAVEQILTDTERDAFAARELVGNYQGASVADWLDAAIDQDAYLGHVEPWMDRNSDQVTAALAARCRLPERIVCSVVLRAVYVWVVLNGAALDDADRRGAGALAEAATLWLAGYAYRCGYRAAPDA